MLEGSERQGLHIRCSLAAKGFSPDAPFANNVIRLFFSGKKAFAISDQTGMPFGGISMNHVILTGRLGRLDGIQVKSVLLKNI